MEWSPLVLLDVKERIGINIKKSEQWYVKFGKRLFMDAHDRISFSL